MAKRFMRRPGRTPRRCAGGVGPRSGGWQERVLVTFLLLPLLVVSCAAVPESGHDTGVQPDSVPLPSPAYYHFLQGYLAELANDVPKAVAEYRAALRFDPDSAFLRVRLAALQFLSGNMQVGSNRVGAGAGCARVG